MEGVTSQDLSIGTGHSFLKMALLIQWDICLTRKKTNVLSACETHSLFVLPFITVILPVHWMHEFSVAITFNLSKTKEWFVT